MICGEIQKHCDFEKEILEFCNKTHIERDKSDRFSTIILVPVPKKGKFTKVVNYRGIGISSTVAKLLNKMIYFRIKPHIERILTVSQNGARAKRSASSLILTIRKLVQGIKDKNLEAILTIVDFSKAYDNVIRFKMFQILRLYGNPPKLP